MAAENRKTQSIIGLLLALFRIAKGSHSPYHHAKGLGKDDTSYRRYEEGQNFKLSTLLTLEQEMDFHVHELHALAAHCMGLPPANVRALCKRIGLDYEQPGRNLPRKVAELKAEYRTTKGKRKNKTNHLSVNP